MQVKRIGFLIAQALLIATGSQAGPSPRSLWTFEWPAGHFAGSPAIGDLDSDGRVDVVLTTTDGHVVALHGDGSLLWKRDLEDPITIAPTVADLVGGPVPEILALTRYGRIYCLDAKTGTPLWDWPLPGEIFWGVTAILAADINNDGLTEIVTGDSQSNVVCMTRDGRELWTWRGAHGDTLCPAVADLDGDGLPEIVVGGSKKPLTCLSRDGKPLWSVDRPLTGSSPVIWDLNGDGNQEILAGCGAALAAFDSKGKVLWEYPLPKAIDSAISVADADRDGAVEIYAVDLSGQLTSLSPDGQLRWSANVEQRARRSPSIGDIDGDGTVEILVAGYSRAIHVFEPDGTLQERVGLSSSCNVTATIVDLLGDGRPCVICPTEAGKIDTFLWENSRPDSLILWPEYRLNSARTASKYIGKEKQPVPVAEFDLADIQSLQTQFADADQRITDLKSLQTGLVDSTGIRERIFYLRDRLSTYRKRFDQIPHPSMINCAEIQDNLRAILKDSSELLSLVRAAARLKTSSYGPLFVCAANPWAPFGGIDEITENRVGATELIVEAFVGETESAALNLFNFGGSPKSLRVTMRDFQHENGTATFPASRAVTFHEVQEVPTITLRVPSNDALPTLNQASILLVPAWEARQLWLNINSAELTPGVWTTALNLRSVEADRLELTVPLRVTIWKSALPKKHPLRLCHWGYVPSSVLKDQPDAALEDQVQHGTNVFVGSFHPQAKYNEIGEIVGEIDFASHDDYVRHHAPHGIILFCGYQGSLQGPGGQDSAAYRKAYVTWMRAWVQHLKELGVDYNGFALYPVDEVGLFPNLIHEYLHCAKLAREADPNIRMYCNPTAGNTMEELRTLAPYVDIWCPNFSAFLWGDNDEQLHFIQSTGKPVWTYECLGHAKHLSPLGYYRGQSWQAWRHRLAGIGFWTYCTSPHDPWFPPRSENEWMMIYQGKGVVSSKRWEAVRDGIEDYSMLSELRKVAESASPDTEHSAVIAAVKKVLEEEASTIADYSLIRETSGEPRPENMAGRRSLADRQWDQVQSIRRKMADLLAQFSAE